MTETSWIKEKKQSKHTRSSHLAKPVIEFENTTSTTLVYTQTVTLLLIN
jgi:hypothetical protein